jgi:hypothetical protein
MDPFDLGEADNPVAYRINLVAASMVVIFDQDFNREKHHRW